MENLDFCKNKCAVTFGRYALFTNAHLSTVKTCLKYWDELHIGIIYNNIPKRYTICKKKRERWNDFYILCNKNNEKNKNFLSVSQRKEMICSVINENNLSHRVFVHIIDRPEYNPIDFNEIFPSIKYDLVFPNCNNENNEFDLVRNNAFCDILERKIYEVEPKIKIHTSEIKKYVFEGKSLYDFIPKSVIKKLEDTKLIGKVI